MLLPKQDYSPTVLGQLQIQDSASISWLLLHYSFFAEAWVAFKSWQGESGRAVLQRLLSDTTIFVKVSSFSATAGT